MKFLIVAAYLFFSARRLLTYLHIYQQEEYDSRRFLWWVVARLSFDTRASLAIVAIAVLQRAIVLSESLTYVLIAAVFAAVAAIEKDPRKASKKKLVLTSRAKRIYLTALGLLFALSLWFAIAPLPVVNWILGVQVIPVALAAGNLLTGPYERKVQSKYWKEAHQKLQSLKPLIVGITGSYGKTSTKHLLGHILEMQAPTLVTPGSVNTPMGIARVVREHLASHHRFFVCEMGAYGPGSIARLCRLAPPDVGLITAIGMAHYERFKSLETVAQTKFELAEAVAAKGGKMILAEQVLELEAAKRFFERYREKTIVVGTRPQATLHLLATRQTDVGIEAEVSWQSAHYLLKAPIYGEHHIVNMALAFAVACTLGVSPDDAVVALASVPQIRHRLELKPGPAGSRLIDDAYNSNPVGFASGLRLLNTLADHRGRRILVTPGMVELGKAHAEEHRKVGALAATTVDVLVAVAPARITTLVGAFSSANPSGRVIPCPDFASAQDWLNANTRADDVVLLENDLPDLYEKKLRL